MALERVRANQTGTGSTEFKWRHIFEVAYDPKTYLFGFLSLCVNFGATVATAFGPTLLKDMGFNKEVSRQSATSPPPRVWLRACVSCLA